MKYCKNCGMLLEDSNDICIGCGTDATNPDNVSDYPLDMIEEIEKEKDESLERNKTILIIIGIFVAILVLICVLAFRFSQEEYSIDSQETEEMLEEEDTDEANAEEVTDEAEEIVEDTEENPDANGEVMVSDADGMQIEDDSDLVNMSEEYQNNDEEIQAEDNSDAENSEEQAEETEEPSNLVLKETSQEDAAGNIIFTTKYPEDFTKPSGSVTRSAISSRFREQIDFNVSNQDRTALFTYISPQQLWFRNSDNGQTRSNETDTANYMSYFTYSDGVETYLESRIKMGNPSLKNIKLVSKESYSGAIDEKVSKLAKDFTAELNTESLGDYASIGSDTQYASLGSESGAYLYKYEAVSGSTTVYMDFYAPFVANKFNYSTNSGDDRGEITEWILLELICFQAGNKEIYDKYYSSFTTFIKESKITREMLYDEGKYYDEIKAARAQNSYPEELTKAKLDSYHSSYSESESIGTFYQNLYDLIAAK